MDIRVVHQLFETFPVLSCECTRNINLFFQFLHLRIDIILSRSFTCLCKFFVKFYTTVRRSIRSYFHLNRATVVARFLNIVSQNIDVFSLRSTNVSLLYQEFDFGIFFFFGNSLEVVFNHLRAQFRRIGVYQIRSNYKSVCNFYRFQIDNFFLNSYSCFQIQFALVKLRVVREHCFLFIFTTFFIVDYRVVTFELFALINLSLTSKNSTCLSRFQYGNNRKFHLFVEVLFGESAFYITFYHSTFQLERIRSSLQSCLRNKLFWYSTTNNNKHY